MKNDLIVSVMFSCVLSFLCGCLFATANGSALEAVLWVIGLCIVVSGTCLYGLILIYHFAREVRSMRGFEYTRLLDSLK